MGTSPPISITRAIGLLIALHFVAGLGIAPFADDTKSAPPGIAFFLGLIVSQAGLTGILAGLGTPPLPGRAVLAAVGLLFPCALVWCVVERDSWEVCELLGFCALLVAAATGLARRRGIELHTFEAGTDTGPDVSLSFGIRHLLILIFVAAVMLKIGQSLDRGRWLAAFFALGLSSAAVGIASPWAALTARRSPVRGIAYVLGAALAGAAAAAYAERTPDTGSMVFWALATAFEALILLVSLGLLRRAGLRLVRTGVRTAQLEVSEVPRC